jgi:hypothetical protein
MIMSINDRFEWQEEVEAHFEEGMTFLRETDIIDRPAERYKEKLLVSYLSDVQELIALNPSKASEHINRIKYMINNCY